MSFRSARSDSSAVWGRRLAPPEEAGISTNRGGSQPLGASHERPAIHYCTSTVAGTQSSSFSVARSSPNMLCRYRPFDHEAAFPRNPQHLVTEVVVAGILGPDCRPPRPARRIMHKEIVQLASVNWSVTPPR
jgi:hypothetical protein